MPARWSAHRCPRFRTDNLQYPSSEWPPRGPPFARAWLTPTLPRWSTVTGAAIIVSKSTEVTPINTLCLIWVMSSSGCAGYYLPVLRILYEAWRVKGTGPGTPLRNGRQNIAASSRSCPRARPSRRRRRRGEAGRGLQGEPGAGQAQCARLCTRRSSPSPALPFRRRLRGSAPGWLSSPRLFVSHPAEDGGKTLGRPHLR